MFKWWGKKVWTKNNFIKLSGNMGYGNQYGMSVTQSQGRGEYWMQSLQGDDGRDELEPTDIWSHAPQSKPSYPTTGNDNAQMQQAYMAN